MSHFLCLVAGSDPDYQLAPFHEFECTGQRDEFCQEFDKTDEYRLEYDKETTRRLKAPDGSLHNPYDNRFYRVATTPEERERAKERMLGSGCGGGLIWDSKDWGDGKGYSTRFQFIPDGWDEVDVPVKDVKTFQEWVEGYYGHKPCTFATIEPEGEHKYGYTLLDNNSEVVKCVDITNPNKRWDWWVIGGRYSDRLTLKDGTRTNQAKKGDIDWFAMEKAAGGDASHKWLTAHAILDQHPAWESWDTIRERHGNDMSNARDEYWKQPAVAAYKAIDGWDGPDEFLATHTDYVQAAVDGAYPGFAFVHERTWNERGEMGWFASVSNEKPEGDWNKIKREFIQSLPDDMLLTVVDCHI